MNNTFLRLTSMTLIWLYCTAVAQASQVITQEERAWARQVLTQEKALETINTPNSLAVMYFNNRSGRARLTPLQKGLAVMLMTDLSKVEQIQVVERTKLQALLDEMELGASGLMDAETAPEVGLLLRANYVTGGDILQGTTKELEISSSVFDVPLDKFTPLEPAAGTVDELFKLEKKVLFNIIDHMHIALSPQKKAELERPLSTNTAALLALFAGIGYSDKGLYAQAAEMYKQALTEDPYMEMAKNALQELKGMGLIRSEEVQVPEETELAEPAADSGGGISTGTVIGVGLGLAAAGAGAVYLLNDDGDNDTTEQAPAEGPTVTDIPFTTPLSCAQGGIRFQFSRDMDTSVGQVDINSPSGFEASGGWDGDYYFSWRQNNVWCRGNCADGCTLTVTLTDFQDTDQNALRGTTTFSYEMEWQP